MPIYAYRCAACGHSRDVLQKLSDAPLSVCPSCGAEQFSKQITAAGVQVLHHALVEAGRVELGELVVAGVGEVGDHQVVALRFAVSLQPGIGVGVHQLHLGVAQCVAVESRELWAARQPGDLFVQLHQGDALHARVAQDLAQRQTVSASQSWL